MSLLKFRCEECGKILSKTRGINDILNVKENRAIACQNCGCKYEIQSKLPWIVNFLLNVIFGIFWVFILTFTIGTLGHWISMIFFAIITIALLILTELLFLATSSLKKIKTKE
jgi:DNA-directed RNA polymerase subunit RPC12/RpoP